MNIQNELVISNCQLVLEDEVVSGSLHIKDGMIADVHQGKSQLSSAVDLNGDYVIPGLVELHTDNMEKHFVPRPGVKWPGQSAVLAHDAQIVGAGITTVFDAIAVGDVNESSYRMENLQRMIDSLKESTEKNLTRADHFLHLRCEVSHENCLELFKPLSENAMVHLVSVMDHSPGQRQFAKMEKYIEYYQGKFKLTDQEMNEFIEKQVENSKKHSSSFRKQIVEYCQEHNIPVASHDDATLEHVAEAVEYKMKIAEFPTTVEAAQSSHDHGLKVLMGAPNIIRGGSHSGNVAAAELAELNVLDILSSDYYPASLLDGAFKLADLPENNFSLPQAVKTVTLNPAQASGLHDRGLIAQGLRADLIHVRMNHGFPLIRQVWNQGERVF